MRWNIDIDNQFQDCISLFFFVEISRGILLTLFFSVFDSCCTFSSFFLYKFHVVVLENKHQLSDWKIIALRYKRLKSLLYLHHDYSVTSWPDFTRSSLFLNNLNILCLEIYLRLAVTLSWLFRIHYPTLACLGLLDSVCRLLLATICLFWTTCSRIWIHLPKVRIQLTKGDSKGASRVRKQLTDLLM